ncbi:MAG: hypothetical protein ACLPND_16025 [Candidatus Korobacteraceae bacterium]
MCGTMLNRALLLIFSILLIASQQTAAQAGHLDPTFGSGGIVTTDFGDQTRSGNVASANAVTIQSDGKIVVSAGIPGSSGFPVPAVARYNTDGSLDTAFGSGGIVSTPSLEDSPFTSVALQSDGKIVAVAGGFTAFVLRYTASGVLDSTFGTSGIVTLSFINGPAASGVLVQPDGNILVANNSLFRLLSNGQFDTSFGSGGTARTAGYPATGLALLPSGKILVVSSFSGTSGFVSQYDSNGSLDTTFGIAGQLASPGTAVGLALLGSGDFLAGGSLTNNALRPSPGVAASTFAVSRYLGVGITDASFGTNGGTVTPVLGFPVVATTGLAVEPNGDIVMLGTGSLVEQTAFALARYTPAGQLDTTFGTNGTVFTSFGIGGVSVSVGGLAIQSDGKIVAVGGFSQFVPHNGSDTAFKVIRYLGN